MSLDGQVGDGQVGELTWGAAEVVSQDELRAKLAKGRPLRVKLGIDPTASDIHLGFAVVLRKLRQFQDLGHLAVLILGDFTARVGDPTGRSATRPQLSSEDIEANLRTYRDQARLILSEERLELRRNSEWLGGMGIDDVLRLTARMTVARLLERDDFQRRMQAGVPVSLTELLYPLLQGWDSVVVQADVELGGADQLFNNLVGRHLQSQVGQEPQIVLTTPLLEGTDGTQKMSKSLGNYIGVADPAADQFGKLMSIPDRVLPRYVLLASGWGRPEAEEQLRSLSSGEGSPYEIKRRVAEAVVDQYHGEGSGRLAAAGFDRVFRERRAPTDVGVFVLEAEHLSEGRIRLARLLALAGLATSNSDGRRKISQGGVSLDGERCEEPEAELEPAAVCGRLLQFGRRSWVKIVCEATIDNPGPERNR